MIGEPGSENAAMISDEENVEQMPQDLLAEAKISAGLDEIFKSLKEVKLTPEQKLRILKEQINFYLDLPEESLLSILR